MISRPRGVFKHAACKSKAAQAISNEGTEHPDPDRHATRTKSVRADSLNNNSSE